MPPGLRATAITVRIKGGEILDLAPPTAVVLINHPFDRIKTPFNEGEVSAAYACNDMHIFRSDEDGRDWSRVAALLECGWMTTDVMPRLRSCGPDLRP